MSDHMNCVGCRVCGTPDKAKVMETRELILGGMKTVWRRKKCLSCGSLYKTAEIPLELAREVLEE